MSYKFITNFKVGEIKKKSILIIGSGYMADQYCNAFTKMGFNDVVIVGNTKNKVNQLCKKYNFSGYSGGFEKNLSDIPQKDLVVIATPIDLLVSAAKTALKFNQKNILLEKPGSLYPKELESLELKHKKKIHLAYNRLFYPSFHKLLELVNQDGGITSCNFSFTEWIHKINFEFYSKNILSKWGISNSLHVISMAMKLIGMPKSMNCIQRSPLSWHKSGSIFVGSGISCNGIPFSYHSDWNSSGRWGIDVFTKNNLYRLTPLEQLFKCKKGTIDWKQIPLKKSFPKVKDGLSEEIISVLDPKSKIAPISLTEGHSFIKLAEKIFNYR